MKKDKNIKKTMKNILVYMFVLGISLTGGWLIGWFLGNKVFVGAVSTEETVLRIALFFVGIYGAFFLQLVIHEAGHLMFGLISGYRFASFRIGSLMWKKEGDKLKLCRMKLAGTGGQCLMSPPDMVDGKIPYVLYNLGGVMLNLIASVICLLIYLLFGSNLIVSVFCLPMVIMGVIDALVNGIPFRVGPVDNDGRNALSLGKSPEAIRAFWLQMKVNEQISEGVRLKSMPEEWFVVPEPEAMKNPMVAAVGAFCCSRKMDAMEFEEADRLMEELLAMDTGMIDLHRKMLVSERIFCELVGENRQELLDQWLTREQKQLMKAMKTNPSVIRTEYAYALLAEHDREKAEKWKIAFEKAAKAYPHQSEIESERELMAYVDDRWAERAGTGQRSM